MSRISTAYGAWSISILALGGCGDAPGGSQGASTGEQEATDASGTTEDSGSSTASSASSSTSEDSGSTGEEGSTGEASVCGDAIVQGDEDCDDGGEPTASCSADCRWVPGALGWVVEDTQLVPQGLALTSDEVWVSGQTPDAIATLRAYDGEGNETIADDFNGAEEFAQGEAIAVGADGAIYIAGATGSPLPPESQMNWTVWGLDAELKPQWTDVMMATQVNELLRASSVALAGDRVTAGGSLLRGGGVAWQVRQYDLDGGMAWTDEDESLGYVSDVTALGDGRVVAVGVPGGSGNVIRSYSSTGAIEWTTSLTLDYAGGSFPATSPAAVVAGTDGIYVAGGDEPKGWVALVSTTGDPVWIKPVSGAVEDLAVDPEGNLDLLVVVAGEFEVVEIDADAPSDGELDAQVDPPIWSLPFDAETPGALAVHPDGTVFVCGLQRGATTSTGRIAAIRG